MQTPDPFSSHSLKTTLAEIVKNLEKRWGLTLVSFLPPDAQKHLKQLQLHLSKLICGPNRNDIDQARICIKLYEPEQFHCTHFTFRRSDPIGAVKAKIFVKKNQDLFELFEIVGRLTSQLQPIEIKLDHLLLVDNGLGIIQVGSCRNEISLSPAQRLLCRKVGVY